MVVDSEMRDTKAGPQALVFKILITQGNYANTEFSEYANINHSSDKAQAAGYTLIANIGKAVGLAQVSDSIQVHRKPFMIEVKTKAGGVYMDDNGVEQKRSDRSSIKKFLPVETGGAPSAVAQQGAGAPPAVVVQQAQQQVAPPPAQAVATPPAGGNPFAAG